MKLFLVVIVAFFATLIFEVARPSLVRPPAISNRHWSRQPFGWALYDNNGRRVASFLGSFLGVSGQVCIFEKTVPCEQFENDAEARKWIELQYQGGGSQ
jgi:hypothetical protein